MVLACGGDLRGVAGPSVGAGGETTTTGKDQRHGALGDRLSPSSGAPRLPCSRSPLIRGSSIEPGRSSPWPASDSGPWRRWHGLRSFPPGPAADRHAPYQFSSSWRCWFRPFSSSPGHRGSTLSRETSPTTWSSPAACGSMAMSTCATNMTKAFWPRSGRASCRRMPSPEPTPRRATRYTAPASACGSHPGTAPAAI